MRLITHQGGNFAGPVIYAAFLMKNFPSKFPCMTRVIFIMQIDTRIASPHLQLLHQCFFQSFRLVAGQNEGGNI